MLCLGIESSCDETALALIRDGILVDAVLASQVDVHALFGGVVPELASREHYRFMGTLFDTLMQRTGCRPADLDVVAVSRGPGLLGSLLVGVAFAKGLALATGARLLGINHLHAHLLAAGLEEELTFPALGLLVSGGHTHLYRMEGPARFITLGRTLDDAAGEAFDKAGKLMGLAYPAGRLMDELARAGDDSAVDFPRPYVRNDTLDFSFSGLKTAASAYLDSLPPEARWPRPVTSAEGASRELCDCCASYTRAIVDTLMIKVERTLARQKDLKTLVLAGGVAANSHLRTRAVAVMRRHGGRALMPSPAYCTDNAVMVAHAGWLLAREGWRHDLSLEAVPRGRPIPDDMHRDAAEECCVSA